MNACCKAYEINGVSHSIDCEIEELLRGKSLENSSTVCVHCTGPIVVPVKNSFCSWPCYLDEVGS